MKYFFILILLLNSLLASQQDQGEELFKKYCWGCHHQTSLAFGPSFSEIASKRDSGQIIAHIVDPIANFKALSYKRTVMPAFKQLNADELQELADYILSFKGK